jgi:hypothetical protein
MIATYLDKYVIAHPPALPRHWAQHDGEPVGKLVNGTKPRANCPWAVEELKF